MAFSKNEKAIMWAGLAVLAYVAWSKFRAASNLLFTPGDVTGMRLQNTTTLIDFTIGVQNTSDTSLSIQSFAGSVLVNGQNVGSVYSFTPVTIAANSQTFVPITMQMGAFQIVSQLISAFTSKSTAMKVSIVGNINGVGVQAPVNLDFTVGV